MLSDDRFREIHDFADATHVFPGVQIKGGVCYFLWKRDESGLCSVFSYNKEQQRSVMERPLLEEGCDTFIRYNEAISILKKVRSMSESSLRDQVSARKPFGLETSFKGRSRRFKNSVTLYQNGGVGYIAKSEIRSNEDIVDSYKVLIPPLGSGSDSFPHPILGRPFIASPNSACTETYLVAGVFDNENEAQNLVSYLASRFLRFLVLLSKPTQHATSKVYAFVPIQNFTKSWDDVKLFKKYGLEQEEISFIESMIRPMEISND